MVPQLRYSGRSLPSLGVGAAEVRRPFSSFSFCQAKKEAKKEAKSLVEEKPRLGRPSNNLKIGVVGLPNIGKSTFFNAVTNSSVPAENFPFCTIGKPREQGAG